MIRKTSLAGLAIVLLPLAPATAQDLLMFPRPILAGALADMNGDGLADLVSLSSEYDSGVTIRLGHGNGTFDTEEVVAGPEAFDILVGDVTGDGAPDILTLRTSTLPDPAGLTLDAYVAAGNSFGLPVATIVPLIGKTGLSHSLADMDADGQQDWVGVGSLDGSAFQLGIELSTAAGSFALSDQLPLAGTITGFAIGDFDADGSIDVATANDEALAVDVHLGAGDGTVAPGALSSPLPAAGSTMVPHMVAGDFDGDGTLDLVAVAGYTPSSSVPGGVLAVMGGLGDGTFAELTSLPLPSPDFAGANSWPALGDLDGDTLPDIAVSGMSLDVFLNDGTGGLLAGPVSDAADFGRISLVDLDSDGVLDVYFGVFGTYALGSGDGSFVGSHLVSLDVVVMSIASADMNVDGAPDLVIASKTVEQGLAIALANADGTFSLQYPSTPNSLHLACGDLDGDGAPDVVLTYPALASAACLFNDGSGTQFPATLDAFDFAAADIQLADVDADGSLDLLAMHTSSNEVVVRRGDGAGGLFAPQASPVGSTPTEIGLGDLDGDGSVDLAASLQGLAPALAIATGLGNGFFAAAQSVPLPDKSGAIVIADLDGNAIPDIATVASHDHGLYVLPAQGPAQFGPVQEYDVPYNPSGLAAGDLDHDGREDLVLFRNWSTGVAVFQNLGGGTFAARQDYIGHSAKSGVLGDFNSDGKLDIAAADAHITILSNVLPDFASVGYQHASSGGAPHLLATGKPKENEKVSFTTTGVSAAAHGFLIVGLQFSPQPFKGGTLVPSPDVAVPMQPDVPLVGRWPALPEGVQVFAQAWFAVGSDVAGSNAVMGIEP